MPLIIAPINKELNILKILVDDKTKKHLENLGVIINSKIVKISQNGKSSICVVKDVRLALDENITSKIFVA